MYRTILVAVDGSESSQLGLQHALQLARDQKARLHIVHVVETMRATAAMVGPVPFDPTPVWEALRQGGLDILAKAKSAAAKAGLEAETVLLEPQEVNDRVVLLLGAEARKCDADLIVAGTHGRQGLNRFFVGSVAEALVRVAPAPVLLVRAKTRE